MVSVEDESTASKIADILEVLGDGKWHVLEELQQKIEVDRETIQQITNFLREYDFIVLDEEKKKTKLNRTAQKFLTQAPTA